MIYRHILKYGMRLFIGSLLIYGPILRADQNKKIGGIGYIQPEGGVIELASSMVSDTVDSIYVHKGSVVEKGALLITSTARKSARIALEQAQLELKIAQEYGDQTVKILRVAIADFEYTVVQARLRQKRLEEAGGAAFSEWQWEEAKKDLFQARNRLSRAQEEYKKERANWDFNVERARQEIKAVYAQLARTEIRAPGRGTILNIHRKPGEAAEGTILSMADLSRMVVVVDIFESDLPGIREGMQATIEHSVLPANLSGRVTFIERFIDADVQTGLVHVRLDQAAPANRFINMKVDVTIHTQP